jgi:SPP1 gp7 family putative phage head morphogenesis protein
VIRASLGKGRAGQPSPDAFNVEPLKGVRAIRRACPLFNLLDVKKNDTHRTARIIVAELHKLEVRGARRARELSARIQSGVIGSFRRKQTPQFANRFIELMQPVLAETMTAAYLTGARRSELTLSGRIQPRLIVQGGGDGAALSDGLALGIFDKTLKFLRRILDADLPTIEAQAETQAFRALRGESATAEREVQRVVQQLIAEGSHVRNGIDVLRETFARLGLSPRSDWRLETIFRTQTQLAYGAGRYEAYSDPAVDEILWGYEYTTAGDDRVRPSHEAMDGVRFRKDDPRLNQWWPPNGWNCRCQLIPIFVDDEANLASPREPEPMPDGFAPQPDRGFAFNPSLAIAGRVTVKKPAEPILAP